jgi:hypothetical protein
MNFLESINIVKIKSDLSYVFNSNGEEFSIKCFFETPLHEIRDKKLDFIFKDN